VRKGGANKTIADIIAMISYLHDGTTNTCLLTNLVIYLNYFCSYNELICACRELASIHVSVREGGSDNVKKRVAAGVHVNIRGM
jgi:hypothetical protein